MNNEPRTQPITPDDEKGIMDDSKEIIKLLQEIKKEIGYIHLAMSGLDNIVDLLTAILEEQRK